MLYGIYAITIVFMLLAFSVDLIKLLLRDSEG